MPKFIRCHFDHLDICVGYTDQSNGEQSWLAGAGDNVVASGLYLLDVEILCPLSKTATDLYGFAYKPNSVAL